MRQTTDHACEATTLREVKSVLVFCGSSLGRSPEYAAAAGELGRLLAAREIEIVYGGASVGLMGALADSALAAGGKVIGVIPTRLVEREIAHPGLTELRVVETMHERKALMGELSDAVIALPGGTGTLDELFELFTWKQLDLVCLVAAPAGLEAVHAAHPEVRIWTAAIDRELDENAYIRPGLGDAGDRVFGTA